MSLLNKITGFFTAKNEDTTAGAGDMGTTEEAGTPEVSETPEMPMEDTMPAAEEETTPEAPAMTPETEEEAPVITPDTEDVSAEGEAEAAPAEPVEGEEKAEEAM